MKVNLQLLFTLILIHFFLKPAHSDIQFISNATSKGALCLDGSPGAYAFDQGFGSGKSSWIVYLYSGAFCHNTTECLFRAKMPYGSTQNITTILQPVSGILQIDPPSSNPEFYNWNKVRIWYCDGGLYSGEVEEVDPSTNLHFRGARIFSAVVEELLENGLNNADLAILAGSSAGGLGTIINCDKFRHMLNSRTIVKCVADAGYLVNVKDISGHPRAEIYLEELVNLHGMLKNLHPLCREEMKRLKMKESLCIFPENFALYVRTPIFFVNAQYDHVQIHGELVPSPPDESWESCRNDITKCNSSQLQTIQEFRSDFLKDFYKGAGNSPSTGYFINGCFDHTQIDTQERWFREDSPRIKGTSIEKAVGDWYFDRNAFKEVGIPYPKDHTCHNFKG